MKTKENMIETLAKKGEKYLLKEVEKLEKNGVKVSHVKKPTFSDKPETAENQAEKYLQSLAKAILAAQNAEKQLEVTKNALKKAKIETSDLKIGKTKRRKKS